MSTKPSHSEQGQEATAPAACAEQCACPLRRLNRRVQASWLVGFVRALPVLHDPRHPRHRDAAFTGMLWDVIGRNLGLPGKKCEEKWKKMCASYESRSDEPREPPLAWQLCLQFDDMLREAAQGDGDSDGEDEDDGHQEPASTSGDAAQEGSSWAKDTHVVDTLLAGVAAELKLLPPYQLSVAMDDILRVARKHVAKPRGDGTVELTLGQPDYSAADCHGFPVDYIS